MASDDEDEDELFWGMEDGAPEEGAEDAPALAMFDAIRSVDDPTAQRLAMGVEVHAIILSIITSVIGTHLNDCVLRDEHGRMIVSVVVGDRVVDATAGVAHLFTPYERELLLFLAQRSLFAGAAELRLMGSAGRFLQAVQRVIDANVTVAEATEARTAVFAHEMQW